MSQLAVSAMGMTALIVGGLLLLVWLRRVVMMKRSGGLDPRTLEVLARVGLQSNQGLAIVRVGSKHLLVSCGDGGVRQISELAPEDLWRTPKLLDDEVEDDHGGSTEQPGSFRAALRRAGAALVLILALGAAAAPLSAQVGPPPPVGEFEIDPVLEALPPIAVQVGDEEEGLRLNGTVGTVVVLGLMTLAPTLLLLTTSFTRILVVLHLLRQALGTQTTPPGHLLAGLALLLTAVVMAPTIEQVRVTAVDPWVAGEIDEGTMLRTAVEPIRYFMLAHTRESDLVTFLSLSNQPPPLTEADIPATVLMSAFVTSELRAAFEIGFAIFLPFIVIDLVVAAVLTSMGMFMLPPTMIALPCKLMLFVLMDGWALLLGTLAQSFF